MIYDCFTFFNELDLLEIRLNILKDVVDKFVLVEATRTFTNRPKDLVFERNKIKFHNFASRIIHVIVDDFPQFKSAWHYESHQRNAISRGLVGATPTDVVLIGDIDEIPRPELIVRFSQKPGIFVFDQTYYSYYLNYRNVRQSWWHGTKMLSYDAFCHAFDGVKTLKNELLPEELNVGTTPSKIRMRTPPFYKIRTRHIHNGGWHFTNLGGVDSLALKMCSFSHQEYNPGEDKIDVERLGELIAEGKGPFWEMRCFAERIDDSYPEYIRCNQEQLSRLIFPVTDKYLKLHRWSRAWHSFRGYVIGLLEHAIPSSVHNFLHLCKLRCRKRE